MEHTLSTQLVVNGTQFTISGKADRIDRRDGAVRIIDYKTGILQDQDVKVSKKTDSVSDIPEKALQLMIYKYLYLKEHPEVRPDSVTASLYGLKNKKMCFDLNVELQALKDDFMGYMETLLTETLASIIDPNMPFTQSNDAKLKPCHFCPAKAICANTVTGAKLANDR